MIILFFFFIHCTFIYSGWATIGHQLIHVIEEWASVQNDYWARYRCCIIFLVLRSIGPNNLNLFIFKKLESNKHSFNAIVSWVVLLVSTKFLLSTKSNYLTIISRSTLSHLPYLHSPTLIPFLHSPLPFSLSSLILPFYLSLFFISSLSTLICC